MVKNFSSGASWIAGVIAQQLGPVTYLVSISGDRIWKRHVDHLKEFQSLPPVVTEPEFDVNISSPSTPTDAAEAGNTVETPESSPNPSTTDSSATTAEPSTSPQPEPTTTIPETTLTPPRRYPSRSHRPPEWFDMQTW